MTSAVSREHNYTLEHSPSNSYTAYALLTNNPAEFLGSIQVQGGVITGCGSAMPQNEFLQESSIGIAKQNVSWFYNTLLM